MTHAPRTAHLLRCLLLLCALVSSSLSRADGETSKLLVARPAFQDQLYGSTILLARDMPDGSALGFIINKPMDVTLAELFPEHAPSLKVPDPVFLGGPFGTNVVFALVERPDSPGAGAMKLAPNLFLVVEAQMVDSIIQNESDHARFLMGMVVWRPGELQEEMKRGLWYEMKTDPRLVVRKQTSGLWEELVDKSELVRNTI